MTINKDSKPWGLDPQCTRTTYRAPDGELLYTEITKPDALVKRELKLRKELRETWEKRSERVASLLGLALNESLLTRMGRSAAWGALAGVVIMILIGIWLPR